MVELLERHSPPGLVVDLCAGRAPHAERLVRRGFGYVGLDPDTDAVAGLLDRGFAAVVADLDDPESLAAGLDAVTAGLGDTAIAAVVAAEGLASVDDPTATLAVVREWMTGRGVETLVIGVANATQVDLAIGTLAGRADRPPWWSGDVRPTRPLGERALTALLSGAGFVEHERDDLPAPEPEVRPIAADPISSDGALLGAHLHDVRHRADDHADVMTFVRLYRPAPAGSDPGERFRGRGGAGGPAPIDLGVTALVPSGLGRDETDRLVAMLGAQADAHVSVAHLDGGGSETAGRADDTVPTIASIEEVSTSHVVVFRGGEHLADDWARHLLLGAERYPGSVVRTGPVDARSLDVTEPGTPGGRAEDAPAGLDVGWQSGFSFADHYLGEETPSAAVAYPTLFLRDLSRVWRDHGPDRPHDLLVEASAVCGVVDTDVGTLAVPVGWRDDDPDVARRALDALVASPVLLAGSSITEVASLLVRLRAANGEIGRLVGELERTRHDAESAKGEIASLTATVDELRRELDDTPEPIVRRAVGSLRSTVRRIRRRIERSASPR